jgi:hypothetical protein
MDDLGIHLLCCSCENEHIIAHDTFRNTVVTIALKSGAHIQREVFHLFPCRTWRWMDVFVTKDNFWTLVNIVIIDLNSCRSQGTILYITNDKRWFYSPCFRNLWLFPSLFWFLFNFLCTCQYNLPLANLLGTFNVYILL